MDPLLTDKRLDKVIEGMREYLRAREFDRAVLEGLKVRGRCL